MPWYSRRYYPYYHPYDYWGGPYPYGYYHPPVIAPVIQQVVQPIATPIIVTQAGTNAVIQSGTTATIQAASTNNNSTSTTTRESRVTVEEIEDTPRSKTCNIDLDFYSDFIAAIKNDNWGSVRKFLNENFEFLTDEELSWGFLLLVQKEKFYEATQLISLKPEIDLNCKDSDKNNALHLAVQTKKPDLMLIKHIFTALEMTWGKEEGLRMRNKSGDTALDIARQKNLRNVINFFNENADNCSENRRRSSSSSSSSYKGKGKEEDYDCYSSNSNCKDGYNSDDESDKQHHAKFFTKMTSHFSKSSQKSDKYRRPT